MRWYRRWGAILVLASLGAGAGEALAQPPVEAFANLPEYHMPRLSPDGRHLAVVRALKGRNAVAIYRIEGQEAAPPAVVDATGGHIVAIMWLNDDRLMVIVKTNKRGGSRTLTWWRAFTVDARGGSLAAMLTNAAGLRYNRDAASVAGIAPDDPGHIYMPLVGPGRYNSWPALHLYRVSVSTGLAEVFAAGTMWTASWIMDQGRVVARIDTYARELRYHVKVPDGDDFREIAAFDLEAGGEAHVWGVGPGGAGLVMEMPSPSGTAGLYQMAFGTLVRTPLYADPQYDIDRAVRDEWTGRVIGAVFVADRKQYVYFDPRRKRFQETLERAFPGRAVSIASCDREAVRSCVFTTEAPREPPRHYIIDLPTGRTQLIGSAYPALAEADLGEVRSYPYAARDGLRIPAYLTLPPGREAKNLPLVVFPHGGPETRDEAGFDWMAQFFANRGYAVLQPNFRGSAGYGKAFRAAGYHQWGLAMQTDLADGAARLAADGIVDPARVCIVGASYGGYAALAGAAFTPGVYACAVSFAGVSDLDEMLRFEERAAGRDSALASYWRARIGDRENSADAARIRATSPALHAERIAVPVLLLHGADDSTVPPAQSRIMRDALARAGKQAGFMEIDGDDHYLDLAETRIRVLAEIEKFLASNIGR